MKPFSASIGVFDSGIGGVSILQSLRRRMPQAHYVYLGDNLHVPYGPRTAQEIAALTWTGIKTLLNEHCQDIVIACNTASAVLPLLQEQLELNCPACRLWGMIEPTVEAIRKTGIQRLGVLATSYTVCSNVYPDALPSVQVFQETCPAWATMVEQGIVDEELVRCHVQRLLAQGEPDAILLGCTHFPFLLPVIRQHLPKRIPIFTQGEWMADAVSAYTRGDGKSGWNGGCDYMTTGDPYQFDQIVGQLMGEQVACTQVYERG